MPQSSNFFQFLLLFAFNRTFTRIKIVALLLKLPTKIAFFMNSNLKVYSVLLHISKTLSLVTDSLKYADLPSFPSPSLITGDSLRPNLVLVLNSTVVYLLELTVCFESNVKINIERKSDKYRSPHILVLQEKYCSVKFINFSWHIWQIF